MRNLTLLTDFYQLTMMNGYLKCGTADREAVSTFFIAAEPNSATS